jgi:hypothetical protein
MRPGQAPIEPNAEATDALGSFHHEVMKNFQSHRIRRICFDPNFAPS